MDERDARRVEAWLGARVVVEGRASAGASNVTWFVRVGDVAAVLRHPPRTGGTLATAHDLGREARALRAFAGTPVPVPRLLACCEDDTVLGVPFVVTERRAGACLAEAAPAHLDVASLADHAIDVLADLHAVDPTRFDMDVPRSSYLVRQIDRWHGQLQRTPTAGRLGDLGPVVAWLHDSRPIDEARTIVHGDYGFHNLLVTASRVEAVLDFELATLGDPVADLFSFLKSWGPAAFAPNPANDLVALAPAARSRDELLARYAQATGRRVLQHRAFYDAFGLWRSIGIFEGIHARSGGTRFVAETPRLVATIRAMMSGAHEQR